MEKCIEHFSHEHHLSLFQVDADEDPKPYRCRICGLPILSSLSYTCSINAANCNFFLHKACTQLPEKFDHPLHLETLSLEESTESYPNFSYRCWNHVHCKFDLHPLVAKPVEIKSQHKSHESHPLVAFCREIVSLCDGCGEEEKGFFFHCQVCNFWVHQNCTILPSVVKLINRPHPFILAYSLPYMPTHSSQRSNYNNRCSICDGEWRLPNGGVYFSGERYSLAHVACAKRRMENVLPDSEILHLPDEEEDAFPSLTIRRFVERNPKNIKTENKMMRKYHEHPLILENACSNSSDDNVVCDLCIKPINMSSPCYRCHDCHFVAHRICADHLPSGLEIFYGPVRYEVLLQEYLMRSCFNSIFECDDCFLPSNGVSYQIGGDRLDLECAVAPKTEKHASHKKHILFQAGNRWIPEDKCRLSCCPSDSESFNTSIYRCVVCNYSIHMRCAHLPKTTRHKFDEHPLELIMTHDDNKEEQGQFCEVCEQQVELKAWYYVCRRCDQYFHINCIPSFGRMSKVKFGRTHADNKLHQHPLTLTRMLTHQRHERCGICSGNIKGFSDDEIAFHCPPCDFWLHFSCASSITRKFVSARFETY